MNKHDINLRIDLVKLILSVIEKKEKYQDSLMYYLKTNNTNFDDLYAIAPSVCFEIATQCAITAYNIKIMEAMTLARNSQEFSEMISQLIANTPWFTDAAKTDNIPTFVRDTSVGYFPQLASSRVAFNPIDFERSLNNIKLNQPPNQFSINIVQKNVFRKEQVPISIRYPNQATKYLPLPEDSNENKVIDVTATTSIE